MLYTIVKTLFNHNLTSDFLPRSQHELHFGKTRSSYPAALVAADVEPGVNVITGRGRPSEYAPLSLICPGDVCDQQLVECVNVDVTAAGCSHPVSSAACHYQPPLPPPPLELLLRATFILILQTHLTVFMDLSY